MCIGLCSLSVTSLSFCISHTECERERAKSMKGKTGDEGVSMCSLECHPRRRKIKAQRARSVFVFFIFVIVVAERARWKAASRKVGWMHELALVRPLSLCTPRAFYSQPLLNKYSLAHSLSRTCSLAAAHLEINKAALPHTAPPRLCRRRRVCIKQKLQSYNFAACVPFHIRVRVWNAKAFSAALSLSLHVDVINQQKMQLRTLLCIYDIKTTLLPFKSGDFHYVNFSFLRSKQNSCYSK